MKRNNAEIKSLIKLFDRYKDAILILNENFIIKYANKKVGRIFPVLKEKLEGKLYWDVVSDILDPIIIKEWKDSRNENYQPLEFYHKDMDKWFEMNISILDNLGYSVTLTNITERMKLKDRINRSNGQYKAFVDASFDNVYEIDKDWNTISMIKEDGILSEPYMPDSSKAQECFHPKDKPYVQARIKKAISKKENYDSEHRLTSRDGQYIWVRSRATPIVDEDGDIVKWIGAANDITLKKEFELRLIEKEKEYLEILDSSIISFYIKDYEKKEVHLSKTWKKKFGWEDLNSMDVYLRAYELIHHKDIVRIKTLFKNSIDQGEEKVSSEYRLKINDKGYIWVLSQFKLIYDEKDKPLKAFGTYMDITDRKIAEIKLKQSEKKANELVSKLKKEDELKDNFISILSHELRNPLATISMGVDLLDQINPGSNDDVETRGIIKRQMKQLIRLVDDLLNTSRIITNKMELIRENIEINKIVVELIEEYKVLFDKKRIKLRCEYCANSIYLYGDPIRIKQAIGNLLTNSLKFTETGGTVQIIVSKEKDSGNIIIKVIDTGIGIQSELLPELFEPFMQQDNLLKKTTSGLGLGLPIAKGIVDLHGGSIEVRSKGLGKGTKFILKFPE